MFLDSDRSPKFVVRLRETISRNATSPMLTAQGLVRIGVSARVALLTTLAGSREFRSRLIAENKQRHLGFAY